jgi:hypothetical protein
VKIFVWQQDQASTDTFFLIHFEVQNILSLKPVIKKRKKFHTEGEVGKVSHIIWMAPNYNRILPEEMINNEQFSNAFILTISVCHLRFLRLSGLQYFYDGAKRCIVAPHLYFVQL